MSQKASRSKGVRHWLHPIAKSDSSDGYRASLTARHVKEVPLDASLLKKGARNYATHRVRRKGLPTHVPPSWLAPQPSSGSVNQHAVERQGEEDFLIKAGRPSEGAWASPKGPKYKSQIIPDQSSDHFDSTYSYVFPHGDTHRPVPTAEHRASSGEEEVCSAPGERLHNEQDSEAETVSTGPSAESLSEHSPDKCHMDSSQKTAHRPTSSNPDSFAFPELPGVVRSFACMPLKPLPGLPISRPGPLEESLLRHQEDECSFSQRMSEQQSASVSITSPGLAQQPSASSQPISDRDASVKEGVNSSRQAPHHGIDFSSCADEQQDTPRLGAPVKEASDAHSMHKATNTARQRDAGSAQKLGPNFEKLLASFHERSAKAHSRYDCTSRTYSNPIFAGPACLSETLHALQARTAEAAQSSLCLSEDTMESTAAMRHPRTYAMPSMSVHSEQKIPCADQVTASGIQHVQHAGLDDSMQGSGASVPEQDCRQKPSFREEGHCEQSTGPPQKAQAPIAAQGHPKAKLWPSSQTRETGRVSVSVGQSAPRQARACSKAAQTHERQVSAACPVTPADISAEASDVAISRQLQAILVMLVAFAALFLGCCILLSWRLSVVASRPASSETPVVEETDYAALTPSWWPSWG